MPEADQNPHNLFNVNYLILAGLTIDIGASKYKNGWQISQLSVSTMTRIVLGFFKNVLTYSKD